MNLKYSLCFPLLILMSLAGCSLSAQHSQKKEGLTRAIIVIPGFKGSLLSDDSDQTLWITPGEALFGSRSLALKAPGIKPDVIVGPSGILRELSLFGIFGQDYYGSFIDELDSRCEDAKIIPFAYDWRESSVLSAQKLHQLILGLRASGITKIDFAAHSMGGLILAWYLRFGVQTLDNAKSTWDENDDFGRIVFAAIPFKGAFQIFHDMKYGSIQGFNTKILDSEALSTFPSSYELLPFGSQQEKSPIYDVNFWQEHKTGLFSNGEDINEKKIFTTKMLSNAVIFRLKLHGPDEDNKFYSKIKALIVSGEHISTDSIETAPDGNFSANPSSLGDDTLTVESSELPKAYTNHFSIQRVSSTLEHYRMINDPSIVDFLCGSKKKAL